MATGFNELGPQGDSWGKKIALFCHKDKLAGKFVFMALSDRQDVTNNSPMNVGRVIYALRRERGLTLEAVAFEAGVDPGNLSRIENGTRQPSLRLLERLAGALGTRVSSVFASAEGLGDIAAPPKELSDISDSDFSNDALELRQCFRDLSPGNKRIALELLRALKRVDRESVSR